jgi:hypothetical protein
MKRAIVTFGWLFAALSLTGAYQGWRAMEMWAFGNTGWEVAAIGQLSTGFGLLFLGVAGSAVLGLVAGRRGVAAVIGSVLVILGVGLGVLAMIAGLDTPVVWGAAQSLSLDVARGYKLLTLKAIGLSGLYCVGSLLVGGQILKATVSSGR